MFTAGLTLIPGPAGATMFVHKLTAMFALAVVGKRVNMFYSSRWPMRRGAGDSHLLKRTCSTPGNSKLDTG
jgi:hypothetical protein